MTPSALVADDEPRLRNELADMLKVAWPELRIVALARNGREALEYFEALQPTVCFLDVHMPGLDGVEAARAIGRRAQLVFVTAYERYAVEAFDRGAVDYLVKPVDAERLRETVARLQERIAASVHPTSPARADGARHPAVQDGEPGDPPLPLRWIRAQVGSALRLIAVDRVDYLQAESKYTVVGWRNDEGKPAEALVHRSLKDLLPRLDSAQFVQVHRSTIVNLGSISHVVRGANETADIYLKGRNKVLRASRSFNHHFRPM